MPYVLQANGVAGRWIVCRRNEMKTRIARDRVRHKEAIDQILKDEEENKSKLVTRFAAAATISWLVGCLVRASIPIRGHIYFPLHSR